MNTDQYAGFILLIEEPVRARTLRTFADQGRNFSEDLASPQWILNGKEVFLLSLEPGSITHAALAIQGKQTVTAMRSVLFQQPAKIWPPVPFHELAKASTIQFPRDLSSKNDGTDRRLNPDTWQSAINALKALRPQSALVLDRLLEARLETRLNLENPDVRLMAEQKDMVNISLRTSGFDPRIVASEPLPTDEATSITALLRPSVMYEDRMIDHDASHISRFGDLIKTDIAQDGLVIFRKGRERLVIRNVNREPIESLTGADLLYFSEIHNSIVLVQYKRMTEESSGWLYRLSDHDREQLKTMQEHSKRLSELDQGPELKGQFRLHSDPFLYKFCRAVPEDPSSTEMIDGIYVPMWYLDSMQDDAAFAGSKGGFSFGPEKVRQNFNNSLFIDLVQNGWIGTRGIQTYDLVDQIVRVIDPKRSLVIAEHLIS